MNREFATSEETTKSSENAAPASSSATGRSITESARQWLTEGSPTTVRDQHTYAMLLHFSQLVAVPVPFLGLFAPVLLWLWQRDQPLIDAHARVVFNWMLSLLLYTLIATALMVVLVGFLGLAILFVANIVQVIMGALRARDGIVRNYALAIRFFKVPAS